MRLVASIGSLGLLVSACEAGPVPSDGKGVGLQAAATGAYGTKLGGTSAFPASAAAPVGVGSVVQLVVALGVVLLLIRYVMPKVLGLVNRRIVTKVDGGIRVEESASFAAGNLYVVTVRGKTLLLSASGANVSCLADLTSSAPQSETGPLFEDVLETTSAPAVWPPAPVWSERADEYFHEPDGPLQASEHPSLHASEAPADSAAESAGGALRSRDADTLARLQLLDRLSSL